MRRFFGIFLCALMLLACARPAAAVDGQVVYVKDAKKFIFIPGTDYSPTDLFPDLKDVMPGDSIQQKILLKNDKSNKCKVKIYMRSLGAWDESVEFLSQLHLTVEKGAETPLFDAPAHQKAQLKDWVYLGTLYSGGQCELIVTLDVPVTMDNRFKDKVGYLDWEFAVEELPVESTDPKPPQTGDEEQLLLWAGLAVGSLALVILLIVTGRKKKEEK